MAERSKSPLSASLSKVEQTKMNDQNKSQVGGWAVNYLFYSALFKNEVLIYSLSLQNLFSFR